MKIFTLFWLPLISLGSLNFHPEHRPSIPKPDGFVLIPTGSFKYNDSLKQVKSFYMSATEISNLQYRTFLNDLKKQGRFADFDSAGVDSNKWAGVDSPFVKYYFNHPAYNDYPVVNITRKGAELYCEWLTKTYKDNYHVNIKATFRLPMEYEWMYAAYAGRKFAIFPWGYGLKSKKGWSLCNYRLVPQDNIHVNDNGTIVLIQNPDDVQYAGYITTPVTSYWPNKWGLYNMSGNVAEMLSEPGRTKGGSWHSGGYDVRIDAIDFYSGFREGSPYIGFRPVMSIE
jgi:formylglycine-generating enzyme required for sulfatase activity